jgi:hypothetical protein
MQRLLVGAADIHSGAPAHRLEPLQHLDVARRVGLALRSRACPYGFRRHAACGVTEQVVRFGYLLGGFCHLFSLAGKSESLVPDYAMAAAPS